MPKGKKRPLESVVLAVLHIIQGSVRWKASGG